MNRSINGANYVRPNWTRRISRAVFMAFVALSLSLAVGCGDDEDDKGGGGDGTEVTKPGDDGGNTSVATAAFAQFGIDVEQIKPNLYTPNETAIKSGNNVHGDYYAKAVWSEKHTQKIDNEIGFAYNERVFNYIKSISADGKCYESMSYLDDAPVAVESYNDFSSFSFKYSKGWAEVSLDYYVVMSSGTDKIGVTISFGGFLN